MTSDIPNALSKLRSQLWQGTNEFCRACFEGGQFAQAQNPPNVFRNRPYDTRPYLFFVFDKPNDNDRTRGKGLDPIEILDNRDAGNPTRVNTVNLVEILGLTSKDAGDPLCSPRIHITNAVKCDKCATTGQTGQIEIGHEQALCCQQRYFFKELEILQPTVLVIFGANADKFVTGKAGPTWKMRHAVIDGKSYSVVRVPHTTATPFNTHGKKGQAYKERLAHLWEEALRQ